MRGGEVVHEHYNDGLVMNVRNELLLDVEQPCHGPVVCTGRILLGLTAVQECRQKQSCGVILHAGGNVLHMW